MLATLRNRDFALLCLGGLVSATGDWTLNIGLPIALYAMTRSITVLSVAMVAAMLPSVLFGSFAGVFVDRWDRRLTMVIANLALAALLLPVLLVRSGALVWIVYPILFLEACLEQFTRPAESALLPSLVGAEHIPPANSLLSVSSNIARLVGPALGGLIAAYFGLMGVTLVDGASFLLAAALVALIAWRAPARAATPPRAMGEHPLTRGLREWLEGLGVVVHERTLAVIFAAVSLTSIGEGVMSVLFVVFVVSAMHGGPRDLGDLMSAQAVGGLLGGLLCGWLGRRLMSRWSLGVSAMLFGLFDLAIFNAPRYFAGLVTLPHLTWLSPVSLLAWELGLFAAVGIPGVAMSSGLQSLVQARTPDRYLGRVFGALMALMALLGVAGASIAGWLGPRFGAVTLLNIQGAGYAVVGLLLLALLPRASARPAGPPATDERQLEPAATTLAG